MSRARRQPPGHGAARARQLGLLPELPPAGEDTAELEAELLALVGGGQAGLAQKPESRAPLPMEAIERMAELCLRDPEEEEEQEEEEEEDEDLMAELQEVLGEEPGSEARPEPPAKVPAQVPAAQGGTEALLAERAALYQAALGSARQAGDGARLRRLERGMKTLQSLLEAARKGKEIKEEEIPPPVALGKGHSCPQPSLAPPQPTLAPPQPTPVPPQPSLAPPQPSLAPPQPTPVPPQPTLAPPQPTLAPPQPTPVPSQPSLAPPQPTLAPSQPSLAPPQPTLAPSQPSLAPPQPTLAPSQPSLAPPQPSLASCPVPPTCPPPTAHPSEPPALPSSPAGAHPGGAGTKAMLLERQRGYKQLALQAKQRGHREEAVRAYRTAKSFDALLEAAAQGHPLEPGTVPPPPELLPREPPAPAQPRVGTARPVPTSPTAAGSQAGTQAAVPGELLQALQQRMQRYQEAANAARGRGQERQARMHQRIAKQYQDAIRAHQAGRAVDLSELPVPPGCQPIPGMEAAGGHQSLAGVLEAAMKLAKQEEEEEEEEEDGTQEDGTQEDGTQEAKPPVPQPCPAQPCAHPALPSANSSCQPKPDRACPGVPKPAPKATARAQQQLEFLQGRRRQLAQAALRAKHSNDLQGAKLLLGQAKALQPLLEASRSGLPVDISKVPEAPLDAEHFVLAQPRGAKVPPEAAGHYLRLAQLIRQQHELCVSHSKQFAHLGNISETTKFERLAEECRQQMETLRRAHAQGCPPPGHHYEQRTFSTIKSFPELGSSDLVLCIVKGINLPVPTGLAPNDLDAFVRFDFPYPSAEEGQRDKTKVVRSSHCPEFQEQFKLHINRGHRGLRRVLHARGIKFEVAHKGGLFKPDRVVGSAQLRLEALERCCELRELLQLLDGRRPTGGTLEVVVRIREPLSCQQLELSTRRWVVIEACPLLPAVPVPKPSTVPAKEVNNRAVPTAVPTVPTLPSLSLLALEQEKLERKMLSLSRAQRPVPAELQQQHRELCQRSSALRASLQRPRARAEYLAQLERFLQLYTDSARALGTEGHREAAKEALYRRNLVERELQKLRP